MSFPYFLKVALDNAWVWGGGDTWYFLEFFWIMLQYSIQALHNILDGANGWKLLLTVVTKSFVLNVRGFLDPTIDQFRLSQ